jgi:hypothetical protein
VRAPVVLGAFLATTILPACGTTSVNSAPTCAKGPGTPISLGQMKTALRSEGIAVTPDHSLCDQDAVTELVSDDPESDLRCTIYRRPVYPKMKAHPKMRYEGFNYSKKAYVVAFANVDCWNYAEGSRRATVSAALRRSFHGLGATSQRVGQY